MQMYVISQHLIYCVYHLTCQIIALMKVLNLNVRLVQHYHFVKEQKQFQKIIYKCFASADAYTKRLNVQNKKKIVLNNPSSRIATVTFFSSIFWIHALLLGTYILNRTTRLDAVDLSKGLICFFFIFNYRNLVPKTCAIHSCWLYYEDKTWKRKNANND